MSSGCAAAWSRSVAASADDLVDPRAAARPWPAAGGSTSCSARPAVVSASTDAARPSWSLAPPPLLDRPRLGHGPLALGRPQPLLHAGQVGRDPLGHDAGVARPVLRLGGQAVPGQGDQLGVGPAAVEPGQGVGQVAARRLAVDLAPSPAR